MENYRPLIGTPLGDLDTPCLLIDLDALEHNQRVVADTYRNTTSKTGQHIKNTKAPIISHMQFRAGGTEERVCTAKVSEAEVMVEGGIRDILVANQLVTEDKITRLCALAKRATMRVAIDDPSNLRALSDAAQQHGVTIGVVIEVNTSMGRAGVRKPKQAVELAKLAQGLPGIAFKGVMSHQSLQPGRDFPAADGKPDRETRFTEGRRYIQMCLDVKDAIESAGVPVEVVSTGETWTMDVVPTIPGVTEVQGGTYALMSYTQDYMTDFKIAAKVLGTVISTPRSGVAIGDVGSRAGLIGGIIPEVDGMPVGTVEAVHEEHVVLRMHGPKPLEVGDKFLLLPSNQDVMIDRWDQYIAVRNP